MYVKIAKYGQIAQEQHGQIAGSVNIELLPTSGNAHHLEIRIEEQKALGMWPEPMVFVSVNAQPSRMYALSTILKALNILDQNQSVEPISDMHEPELN